MGLVEHTVCRKIPHLGVAIGDLHQLAGVPETSYLRTTYVLLHAQEGFPWPILSVAHVAEFLQVLFDRLLGMLAAEAGAGPLLTAALELDFLV